MCLFMFWFISWICEFVVKMWRCVLPWCDVFWFISWICEFVVNLWRCVHSHPWESTLSFEIDEIVVKMWVCAPRSPPFPPVPCVSFCFMAFHCAPMPPVPPVPYGSSHGPLFAGVCPPLSSHSPPLFSVMVRGATTSHTALIHFVIASIICQPWCDFFKSQAASVPFSLPMFDFLDKLL